MQKLYLKLAIFFILVLCTSGAAPDIKIVDKGYYKVGYSEALEEPLWIEYKVMCTETKFSRKGLDFYPEKGVKTSDNDDYANNEWDKGHMAPAADFACDSIALRTTFSYVNCSLQQENLNRGVWRYLEARERELAKTSQVNVRIDVIFDSNSKTLSTGAKIPSAFNKTIRYGKTVEKYHFPNVKPKNSDPKTYLIN